MDRGLEGGRDIWSNRVMKGGREEWMEEWREGSRRTEDGRIERRREEGRK